MQLSEWQSYVKTAGVLGAIGAILAGAASFVAPRKYTSSAMIQVTSWPPGKPVSASALGRLPSMELEILSRGSLAELIGRPALNLYRNERHREPLEDIIEEMRKDIRIEMAEPRSNSARAFRISYSYRDRRLAQAVVNELVSKFIEQNLQLAHMLSRIQPGLDEHNNLEALAPASPAMPVRPNRLAFVAWGLGLGMLTGLMTGLVRRQPRWTFRMTAFGASGCALAFACSLLIPDLYLSSTVLRLGSPRGTVSEAEINAWLERTKPPILSSAGLAGIIQRPSLNLYAEERARRPLEDVVEEMRRKISVESVRPSLGRLVDATPAIRISFGYRDSRKAQAVTRDLVIKFADRNLTTERAAGYTLEVIDPASLPETSIFPNRFVPSALGCTAGLIAGALILRRKRTSPPLSV